MPFILPAPGRMTLCLVYDVFFGGYRIERFLTKAAFLCGFFVLNAVPCQISMNFSSGITFIIKIIYIRLMIGCRNIEVDDNGTVIYSE